MVEVGAGAVVGVVVRVRRVEIFPPPITCFVGVLVEA